MEPGEFNIEIKHPKNGRWTYFNPDTQLEVGDVIYYWIVVHYNNFGYRKDDQIYNVTTVKRKFKYNNNKIKTTKQTNSNGISYDIMLLAMLAKTDFVLNNYINDIGPTLCF